MGTVLWDEIRELIRKEGGNPEIVFKSPALTRYWLKKYDKRRRRKKIATKPAEELLEWIYQTIREASEEELADTALEIFSVLKIRKKEVVRYG